MKNSLGLNLSKFLFIFLLIIIFIFISAKKYSEKIFNNISDNFLRFHVIANSDSTDDQILKYKIRDSILDYYSNNCTNINSKEEAISFFNNNIDKLYEIAYSVLSENHVNLPLNIYIGKSHFPTKEYSQIILPEGTYDALKIEIGAAKGQNWWCIMFPTLCFFENSEYTLCENSSNYLSENLNSEELNLINNAEKSNDLKIKFKLIEIFENL